MIYSRYGFATGNWSFVAVLTVALAGTWWYLRRLPSTRVGRVVQSNHVVPTETASKTHLVDQYGVSLTPLRPGGMAQIGAERVDVVTSGEPIERGQKLRVISVEGTRVLVRAV
jgi:membrane-bound serine protease (ClpP class)